MLENVRHRNWLAGTALATVAFLAGVLLPNGRGFCDAPPRSAPAHPRAKPGTIVVTSTTPEQGGGQAQSRQWVHRFGVTRSDCERIATRVPHVRKIVPIREMQAQARYGEWTAAVRLVGTTSEFSETHHIEVARGRFLSRRDVATLNNVAVLSDRSARTLFPLQDPIGKSFRIGRCYFLVVGLLRAPDRDPRRPRDDSKTVEPGLEVYIPASTMRTRFGDHQIHRDSEGLWREEFELSRIVITVDAPENVHATTEAARRLLQQRLEPADFSVAVSQ